MNFLKTIFVLATLVLGWNCISNMVRNSKTYKKTDNVATIVVLVYFVLAIVMAII